MKRLESIRPAVEKAAKVADLPTYKVDRPPVGFDGDAWVWTWRRGEERIAEVSVLARPEAIGAGVDIRVTAGAWMLKRRDVATSMRLFYSRYFDEVPPVDALAIELGQPLKNAWNYALTAAEQLPQIEEQRAKFLADLRGRKLLDEG